MALSQLAAAWPSSRTVSIELDEIGAYSFNVGGQLMANVSVLPFGGAPSLDVAYVAGISLISNMYTAERMEAFTRSLLYPTITAIVNGRHRRGCGSRSKARLPPTRACRRLSTVSTVARQHAAARSFWQWRRWLLRLVSCTKSASSLSISSTSMVRWTRQLARRTGPKKATTAFARPWLTTHSKRNLVS